MKFMDVCVQYGPQAFFASGSGGSSSSSGSLSAILQAATELLTWFVTSMGSFLNFVTSNPVVLMMFLILLVGSAVGMLMRIWHSA